MTNAQYGTCLVLLQLSIPHGGTIPVDLGFVLAREKRRDYEKGVSCSQRRLAEEDMVGIANDASSGVVTHAVSRCSSLSVGRGVVSRTKDCLSIAKVSWRFVSLFDKAKSRSKSVKRIIFDVLYPAKLVWGKAFSGRIKPSCPTLSLSGTNSKCSFVQSSS